MIRRALLLENSRAHTSLVNLEQTFCLKITFKSKINVK